MAVSRYFMPPQGGISFHNRLRRQFFRLGDY
jgi:hypothetical protein